MKFNISWLKELSGTSLSDEQIATRLTMLGLEVEALGVEEGPVPDTIIVGHVMHAEKIAGTNNLNVCELDVGGAKRLQIVCGAPNVSANQKVPVAPVGTVFSNGLKIKKAKLRGVVSEGMICSEAELGLSSESDGIMVLNDESIVGGRLADAISSNDPVMELFITPNRPDCMGMLGLARELNLSERKQFKPNLKMHQLVEHTSLTAGYKIDVAAPEECPTYTGRIIENIKVGESPQWLVDRVEGAGMRSINNVVDITNYVMLLTGQPLHAFDLDCLKNGVITVRNARDAEDITTLDAKTYKLTPENLLICDGEVPIALAGVMGGHATEVSTDTTTILLESACFSSESIRKTSRKLGIFTEASKRFERGTDPNAVAFASNLAASLFVEYANGSLASSLITSNPDEIKGKEIVFRPSRADSLLGTRISEDEIEKILVLIGCQIIKSDFAWTVNAPTFRPDLLREVDLIEEVARAYGYDNVLPDFTDQIPLKKNTNTFEVLLERSRNAAIKIGLTEFLTYGFVSRQAATPFIQNPDSCVELLNPLSEDLAVMRPSVLASMLPGIAHNINRKQGDQRIFEVGSIFRNNAEKQCIEEKEVAVILTGSANNSNWRHKAIATSFYDVKGFAAQYLRSLFSSDTVFKKSKSPSVFKNGQDMFLGTELLGTVGQIRPDILSEFNIKVDVFAFTVNLSVASRRKVAPVIFQPYSQFPAIERDLAFLVDQHIEAENIAEAIRTAGTAILVDVHIFDVYSGSQVSDGKKSIAFALKFQSPTMTLRDKHVDKVIKKILNTVQKRFGAELRV